MDYKIIDKFREDNGININGDVVSTGKITTKKKSAKPTTPDNPPLLVIDEITPALRAEAKEILVEQRRLRVQAFIEEKTERSASVIHELLDGEDNNQVVRLAAAKDILDRGGFKPVERLAVAVLQPITGMRFEFDQGDEVK